MRRFRPAEPSGLTSVCRRPAHSLANNADCSGRVPHDGGRPLISLVFDSERERETAFRAIETLLDENHEGVENVVVT